MFQDRSELLAYNPAQLHYGVAVADIDGDGEFEFFIAGYGVGNRVFKWTGMEYADIADPESGAATSLSLAAGKPLSGNAYTGYATLADIGRQAIGVAAGDIDGDGREEIYVLNTDRFMGRKQVADRLFDWNEGRWQDLFTLPANRDALNLTAGRSVICVDRTGDGRYSFFVASYGGPMRCYELEDNGFLADLAPYIGLAYVTGGRSLLSLPLLSRQMDIFAGNENGPNFLFRNQGDGTYAEEGDRYGVADPYEHARGVAALDTNGDGRFDLVVGNWEGMHRLYVTQPDGRYLDVATEAMAAPSMVRTVIAADFDNDGYEELFFNNIGQPNRLFGQRDGHWVSLPMGDAIERNGLGTGAAVADLDGDGYLELLIAHGESGLQPLSLYRTSSPKNVNHWLRIRPLTAQGAPARGAVVTLQSGGRTQRRAIDAGSGYLCQMEPVAHFGLGTHTSVAQVQVQWPDGTTRTFTPTRIDTTIRVPHP